MPKYEASNDAEYWIFSFSIGGLVPEKIEVFHFFQMLDTEN